jgi:DNA-binding response OmpR family regulator
MRMESDTAGMEVVAAAKKAACRPAIAMLTAFPLPGSEGEEGADKLLVKPMNTSDLLRQLEALLVTHEDNKRKSQSGGSMSDSGDKRKPVSGSAAGKSASAESKSARKPQVTKLAEAH